MGEVELTPAAKDAIRSYMLKFALPSALILTTVSGALGFVVSGLARIEASNEASKFSLAAAANAAEAKANANQAATDAADALAKARAAATNAEDTQKYLLSVKGQFDKILAGQYEGLAKSLFEIKAFRDSIQTIPDRTIGDVNAKLREIEKVLYEASEASIAAPGNRCPAGSYAFGVGSVSVSGGAHGYLESISVLCKPLRFGRPS